MGMFDFLGIKQENPSEENTVEAIDVGGKVKSEIFVRFEKNPLISPDPDVSWKSFATFNPAAIFLEGKVHLLYRAQGENKVSTFGYASSDDGFTFSDFSSEPAYIPRAPFEMMTTPGWNSGCEDARITKINGRLYLTYTAYDGSNPPRVALSSISVSDFLDKKWNWTMPKLISPPGVDDKDCCIIEKAKGAGLVAFHRLGNVIWLDSLRDLNFPREKYLTGGIMAQARPDFWDNVKIGIASPPIETPRGWLLFYHAVSNPGFVYKIGAMLLDFDDPRIILMRSTHPLLEPQMQYEKEGQVANIVFSCGAVVLNNTVFLYYGGGDKVVCLATMGLTSVLDSLERFRA